MREPAGNVRRLLLYLAVVEVVGDLNDTSNRLQVATCGTILERVGTTVNRQPRLIPLLGERIELCRVISDKPGNGPFCLSSRMAHM